MKSALKHHFTQLLSTILLLCCILCPSSIYAAEDESDFDVVVIGGGLMGSSAAWQLARAGQKVLLLEKQAWPYNEGSSLGETRISRSLGSVDDIWSYMHNHTVAETRLLIDFLNQHEPGHAMTDVYVTSPVSYVRHVSHANRIESIEDGQKDDYLYAKTPEQAMSLFDLTLPGDNIIYREFKEHSGTINPTGLIELLHKGIRILSGSVNYQSRVDRLTRDQSGYAISITDLSNNQQRTLSTRKMISAAGPYTGELLEEVAPYFNELIKPQRVFLAFLSLNESFYSRLSPDERDRLRDLYPAINSTIPGRDTSFFTMLEKPTSEGLPVIKIGGHFQRSPISNLDEVWRLDLTDSEIDWSRESTLRHLALLGVDIQPQDLIYISGYSCVYSLTESEVPYVTQIVDTEGNKDSNMMVIAGLSGVGGKGAMAYGVMAANQLLQKDEEDPVYQKAVEAFGFERLLSDLEEL